MEKLKSAIKNKKLIIFDLDGVICKLNVDWFVCRVKTKEYLEKKFGDNLDGMRVDQMEVLVLEKYGSNALKEMMFLREKFESDGVENSAINYGMVEFIKELHKRGYKQAICSNNLNRTVEKLIKLTGIEECIEYFVGIDDTFKPKPNIEGCQKILDKFSINKEDIIFVGDNPDIDGKTAENLNIDYINIKMSK